MSTDSPPTEFVLSALRPRIAVMTSPSADVIAMRNNLSLVEILRPLSRLETTVRYTDPLGGTVSVNGLNLQFDSASPPPASVGGPGVELSPVSSKLLADIVRESCPADFQSDQCDGRSDTPWFKKWRDTTLQLLPPGDHEFHRRFLACLLVVGCGPADSDPEPLIDQLLKLQQVQRQLQGGAAVTSQSKLPEACNTCWFSNNTLVHFVLLSDVSTTPQDSAGSLFAGISAKLGDRCCSHVRINSRSPALYNTSHEPDPWLPHLHLRRLRHDPVTAAAVVTSGVVSGSETPAELADLVSLPAHIAESPAQHSQHPLSSARASSPSPAPGRSPCSPAVSPVSSDNSAMFRSESAPQLLPVNKVNYPRLEPPISESVSQIYGACLCEDDFTSIREFVRNFAATGLLPHVERMMRSLNDTVGNRKGVSGSLLSVTKRWFGSGKLSSANSTGHLNTVVYNQEAPEIQVRKLGDLAIMFGQYNIAYQAFHAVKRDFGNDTAWLHFAGAAEMAALSMFLHGVAGKQFPQHYLQQAITTYTDTCRMPWYGLRATLYSAECLKARGLHLDAALQFVKSTSEDNDLSTALLLEQAALCFISGKMSSRRKYAFHMVLAGHRFAKAAQRQHSVRAYRRALQVYRGRGWVYADDHIHFALARHCLALKDFSTARDALTLLLNSAVAADGVIGQHTGSQHALTLRELISVHQKCSSHLDRVSLSIPVIDAQRSIVLLSTDDDANSNDQSAIGNEYQRFSRAVYTEDPLEEPSWYSMEEQCCARLSLTPGPTFRPTALCMSHLTTNSHVQTIGVHERVLVKLLMRNPLRVGVLLSHVHLRCRLLSADGTENGTCSCPDTTCLLPANSSLYVTLSVSAHGVGTLNIDGVEYNVSISEDLSGPTSNRSGQVNGSAAESNAPTDPAGSGSELPPLSIGGYQCLGVRGVRLKKSQQGGNSCSHGPDYRFQFRVEERECRVRVYISPLPSRCCAGALLPVSVCVYNAGTVPVSSVLLAFLPTGLFKLLDTGSTDPPSANTGLLQLTDTALQPGSSSCHRLMMRLPPDCDPGAGRLQILGFAAGGGRYFFERHSTTVTVSPSLRASLRTTRVPPSLVTSSSEDPPLGDASGVVSALRLDLRAGCDSESVCSSISVRQVSLLSSHWSLLPHHGGDKCCSLSSGEEEMYCLSALRRVSSSNPQSELLFSQCSFCDNSDEPTNVCRSLSADVLHQADSERQLSADVSGTADSQSAEVSGRLMANAVKVSSVLAIHWQATDDNGSPVRGVHFIYVDRLDQMYATYRQTVELRQREPITFSTQASGLKLRPDWWPGDDVVDKMVTSELRYQQSLSHRFSLRRLCLIPVSVHLTNHTDCELVVHVRAVSDKQSEGAASSSPLAAVSTRTPPSRLLWLGATRFTVSLGAICDRPGETVVRFTAAVSAAGVYNLAAVEVTCRRAIGSDSEFTVQQTELQSLVFVRDADHESSR